jgi:hypothetical protein
VGSTTLRGHGAGDAGAPLIAGHEPHSPFPLEHIDLNAINVLGLNLHTKGPHRKSCEQLLRALQLHHKDRYSYTVKAFESQWPPTLFLMLAAMRMKACWTLAAVLALVSTKGMLSRLARSIPSDVLTCRASAKSTYRRLGLVSYLDVEHDHEDDYAILDVHLGIEFSYSSPQPLIPHQATRFTEILIRCGKASASPSRKKRHDSPHALRPE